MTEWNRDMTTAPRGRYETRYVKTKNGEREYKEFVTEKVWLSHPTDGRVYLTYWTPPTKHTPKGRWSGWCEGTEAKAWMPFVMPSHVDVSNLEDAA